MLEDLRNSALDAYDEEKEAFEQAELERRLQEERKRRFLGLTAAQRFVISLLVFLATILLGFVVLLVTNRIWF